MLLSVVASALICFYATERTHITLPSVCDFVSFYIY